MVIITHIKKIKTMLTFIKVCKDTGAYSTIKRAKYSKIKNPA